MPVDDVRDLGVIIDSKLTMESHVQSVAPSCFYQLRQLRSIQRSLTANARRLLAVAFIIASRVDYCNAVLLNVFVPRMRTKLETRSFRVAAPVWNHCRLSFAGHLSAVILSGLD